MQEEARKKIARSIMDQFAVQTGLSPESPSPKRYLWTDAFAVCNFLGLYLLTQDRKCMDLALGLIDQVHNVLGKHRPDDERIGWISGLSEEEGKAHPTRGGLRIGKTLNERKPSDPVDEQMEWERDGQYFHYLIKWMHALNRTSTVTGDPAYNRWAIELAKAAHAGFIYTMPGGGQKRMFWKMSIDLTYPLVPSMGHHDPLDGFITYSQLRASREQDPVISPELNLDEEINDMVTICKGKDWQTDDPLGLGGLLSDAYRAAQLVARGALHDKDLPGNLLMASLPGLKACVKGNLFRYPAQYRLAFRELGLSIGLHAVEMLEVLRKRHGTIFHAAKGLHTHLETLMHYVPLGKEIETFWLQGANQASVTWANHRDINMVMLATSLAPEGYLTL